MDDHHNYHHNLVYHYLPRSPISISNQSALSISMTEKSNVSGNITKHSYMYARVSAYWKALALLHAATVGLAEIWLIPLKALIADDYSTYRRAVFVLGELCLCWRVHLPYVYVSFVLHVYTVAHNIKLPVCVRAHSVCAAVWVERVIAGINQAL